MPREVSIQGRLYAEHDLVCPDCGARLLLEASGVRLLYRCEGRREKGCQGVHGARRNGLPLGIPGDRDTRQARKLAHAALEPLCRSGQLSKKEAYIWIQHVMSLPHQEAHIGYFSKEQCQILINLINARAFEGFSPPLPPIAIDPNLLRAAIEPGMGLMKLAKKLGLKARIVRQELQRNGIALNRQPAQATITNS